MFNRIGYFDNCKDSNFFVTAKKSVIIFACGQEKGELKSPPLPYLFFIIRFNYLTQFFFKVENIVEVCDFVFSFFLVLIKS